MDKKQRGYMNIDLGGLIAGLLIAGCIAGAAVALLLNYSLPWLWEQIKPWLHSITA